jgi:hypothetical protein
VALFEPVGLIRGKIPEPHDGGLVGGAKPLKER